MYRRTTLLLLLWMSSMTSFNAKATELSGWSGYFYTIDQQFVNSFAGYNSLNHIAAIGASTALVGYDIDWRYYHWFYQHPTLQYTTFPAVILGGIAPVALPAWFHYYGYKENDRQRRYTAYALGQAAMLSIAVSSLYKAFTGRLEPEIFQHQRSLEQSKQFEFGFLNNGIFNGWPSGHATNTMALAAVMSEMYPGQTSTEVIAYVGAVYVSIGVSTNIHWLSDAFAGSLIGYAIGKTVGRQFRAAYTGQTKTGAILTPFIQRDALGLSLVRMF